MFSISILSKDLFVSAENKGVRVSGVRRPEQSSAKESFEDSGLVSLSDP